MKYISYQVRRRIFVITSTYLTSVGQLFFFTAQKIPCIKSYAVYVCVYRFTFMLHERERRNKDLSNV